jgi:hypothetical protein
MQVKELDTKLEMEKKNVKYQSLEKEAKSKWEGFRSAVCLQVPPTCKSLQSLDSPMTLSQELNSRGKDEIEDLKIEIEKLKKRIREVERENSKLKRNF